jgi:hydrogenase maturation protease
MPPRILIAGIGNIFLGDDAFGVEVVRRLSERPLPEGVRVVDFGIRGFDLTLALLEDDEVVILVDAAPRGGAPGTLYLIEPEPTSAGVPENGEFLIDPHSLDPAKVLRVVAALGGRTKRVMLLGCEPASVGWDDDPTVLPGMSEPVQAAVDEAVRLVESLVQSIRENAGAAVAEEVTIAHNTDTGAIA